MPLPAVSGIKKRYQDSRPRLRRHLLCYSMQIYISSVASSPGHSQILSSSRGEKSGEGLGSKLRHGPEMVDLVSTNQVHVTYKPSPPFPVRDVVNSTLVISG